MQSNSNVVSAPKYSMSSYQTLTLTMWRCGRTERQSQCDVKMAIIWVGKYYTSSTQDIRSGKKTPPLWMIMNLEQHKCWCGTPHKQFYPYQRKYCKSAHAMMWAYYINPTWDTMRHVIMKRDYRTCAKCGHISWDNEVDHIIPKAINPDLFWEESNLHVLCSKCHKEKTASDRRTIAISKKSAKSMTLSDFQ